MATVLITGGTGLIGRALTDALIDKGYEVIVLSRRPHPSGPGSARQGLSFAQWDLRRQFMEREAIQKADFVVHLAGASVAAGRWTESRKREILESRTKSSALLLRALRETPNRVKAVVSASAIGWYGPDRPDRKPFVETDPADSSFLGQTCLQWENSIDPVVHLGKRLVKLRTGIVLSNEDGAYAEFKKPLRLGVASILGNGRQVVSWIHIADIVGLYVYAIENEKVQGVYNAVAPAPVSNSQLIQTIAQTRNRFFVTTHVPELALKLALGEMSVEVLKSATVSSKKVENAGYHFLFPSIEAAVQNLENTGG